MIDQLLSKTGANYSSLVPQYYDTPLVSGFFIVKFHLCKALEHLIDTNVYDILERNVKSISLPNSNIQDIIRDFGNGVKISYPIILDQPGDIQIQFYENIDFDILSIFEIWKSVMANPTTTIPKFKKPFGEPLHKYIKGSITVCLLSQNALYNNQSRPVIIRMYGWYPNQVALDEYGPSLEQNSLVQPTVSCKIDRIIVLTESTSNLLNMTHVYNKFVSLINQYADSMNKSYTEWLKKYLADIETSIDKSFGGANK